MHTHKRQHNIHAYTHTQQRNSAAHKHIHDIIHTNPRQHIQIYATAYSNIRDSVKYTQRIIEAHTHTRQRN
jgi:gentisate 1,2-dioxygenase